MDKLTKQKYGYIEGWLSASLNILLFGLKLWAGITICSISMIADAWHTLSDTLTSIIIIVGFWISSKPKDKEHPYGHGRSEIIGTMIIGILLSIVGLSFMKESFLKLKHVDSVEFKFIGIVIFAISVFIKEGLAQFAFWAGKKIKSKALIADGWHHRSDAIASFLIVIGALFGKQFWWIDGVLGIIVSLFILYAAFDILKVTINSLMGEEINKNMVETIRKILQDVSPEISHAHHFHIHSYGDHEEVTMHIKMPGQYSLDKAHNLATKAENRLRDELKIETTIHIEPKKEF